MKQKKVNAIRESFFARIIKAIVYLFAVATSPIAASESINARCPTRCSAADIYSRMRETTRCMEDRPRNQCWGGQRFQSYPEYSESAGSDPSSAFMIPHDTDAIQTSHGEIICQPTQSYFFPHRMPQTRFNYEERQFPVNRAYGYR